MKNHITQKIVNESANALTMSNLIFGLLALVSVWHGLATVALVLILGAATMDILDGRVARRLNIVSPMGRELDSLCDLVSFGIAPAFLACSGLLTANPLIASLLLCLFITCGAFRLARFNILNIGSYYIGLPITIAGVILACFAVYSPSNSIPLLAIVIFTLSAAMVSTLRIPKV